MHCDLKGTKINMEKVHSKFSSFLLIRLFTPTVEGQATTFSTHPLSIRPFHSVVRSKNSSPEIRERIEVQERREGDKVKIQK